MEPNWAGLERARAVLIAGPTASGKTAAALWLAEQSGRRGRPAFILNADSMQVYDALRVLTARPDADAERRVPHRLFGHVPAETRYSVGAWLRDASAALHEARAAGALPIVVGGTGLYFKALTEGLAETPDVPAAIRAEWSARRASEGTAALHSMLGERDPRSASAIRPSDAQRTQRALEVLEATGRSLVDWRADPPSPPLLSLEGATTLVIEPERAELHRRIDARLRDMMRAGALDEVRDLLACRLDPRLPVMKALGVTILGGVLREELSLEEGLSRLAAETRRYAKRQMTWFRGFMGDWPRLEALPPASMAGA